MKWTTTFVSIEFDTAAYNKVLLNALIALNERAGKAWITEAVQGTPIPTWGGASRGTFLRLATELKCPISIGKIEGKKNINLGVYSAAGSGVVEDKKKPYVGFIYTTALRHLAYNEYNKAVAGKYPQPWSDKVRFTPYGFQSRALDAWEVEAKTAKLPDPMKYIKQRKM
jgi:hypothetical protein